jgi:hypothetical protein
LQDRAGTGMARTSAIPARKDTIGSITEDRALSDVEKITRIRALLATRETRRLLEKDPIVELKASLASELGEDDYYKILESKSVWIQNRVNPVLKALTFQAGPSVRKLVDAVEHFKEKDGTVDKSAPAGFLDPEEGAAVQKEGKFRVSSIRRCSSCTFKVG